MVGLQVAFERRKYPVVLLVVKTLVLEKGPFCVLLPHSSVIVTCWLLAYLTPSAWRTRRGCRFGEKQHPPLELGVDIRGLSGNLALRTVSPKSSRRLGSQLL